MTAADTTATQHGTTEHSHGPGTVPVQTRSERLRSTVRDDYAPLTGREAEWKHTPVAKIAALADAALDGGEYPFQATELAGVTVQWVAAADAERGLAGLPEDRVAANAYEQTRSVLSIVVDGELAVPFTLGRAELGASARAAHTVIRAKAHSKAVVVLHNAGAAQLAENVEIILEDGADLQLIAVQEWDESSQHLGVHFATVGRDARLRHILVNLGGAVVRVNPSVHLNQPGGDAELYGLYFADAGQHLEQQVFVHHDAEYTRSRVNYKGALQGKDARSVWIGDVLIGRKGTGTDSYEQNRNLVLSEGTRADSVPNLEIETGDIAGAGHASTTGRFDDEQLFYLQSRGIDEEKARRLVVHGFLAEILQKIEAEEIRARLEELVESELAEAARA